MKRKKFKKKDLNLIPMINIIFLLLIFFMLTGVIQKKSLLNIERPISEYSRAEIKNDQKNLVIVVDKNKVIYIRNIKTSFLDFKNEIQKLNNNFDIILEVDKTLSVKEFSEILSAIKKVGIKKVFIRSLKSNG